MLRIRPMTGNDLFAVMNIEMASFSTPWSPEAFLAEMEGPLSTVLILESDALPLDSKASSQKTEVVRLPRLYSRRIRSVVPHAFHIVGYAVYRVIIDEAHLLNIAIAPETRGAGLGRLLLEHVESDCADQGADRILLEVRPSNDRARALYAAFGYVEVGRRKRYYEDTREDAILMDRILKEEP